MELFYLNRHTDLSGVSGTGRVAEGVIWPDGSVTLWWHGNQSVGFHKNIDKVIETHGHDGRTSIVIEEHLDESTTSYIYNGGERPTREHGI